MDRWIWYAIVSMVFAGATGVVAKLGLTGISAELGLAVRTSVVFLIVLATAAVIVPRSELQSLTAVNLGWLALSGALAAISWIFYYKAIHAGEVATVALIDKGSVVVAVVLAFLILKEPITAAKLVGGSLMVLGLVVVARG
ncbi:membrane protein [Steroidobacter denitrificans]|jgi:transporter family protein|uniref:Membrane protein n=1 Tax=Steroidobacter denitrificans TaxID=465721 RepID=A0A127FCA7_STEDE|nr:EamA family transporter [Steroidobacter denitrificans]AMN48033.1 membrane protein [Steroidobacter denitrificans]